MKRYPEIQKSKITLIKAKPLHKDWGYMYFKFKTPPKHKDNDKWLRQLAEFKGIDEN